MMLFIINALLLSFLFVFRLLTKRNIRHEKIHLAGVDSVLSVPELAEAGFRVTRTKLFQLGMVAVL